MNNKEQLSDRAKSRLYGMTSFVCSIWTIQTLIKAITIKSLWSWPNIIFYLSMIIVIFYTGLSAYQMMKLDKINSSVTKPKSKSDYT